MSDELKPCPFCGGKAILALEEHTFDGAEVTCIECGCQGGHYEYDPLGNEAASGWNTRTDTIQSAAYVAGLEKALCLYADERNWFSAKDGVVFVSAWRGKVQLDCPEFIARAALASRPASTDVRVDDTRIGALKVLANELSWSKKTRAISDRISAIIGGQP